MSKPTNNAAVPAQPVPASCQLVVANCIGFAVTIVVNVLAATGKLGPTNAEISEKYPTVITPSGWAFSIWGIIFTLELLAVIIQGINFCQPNHGSDFVNKMVNAVGYCWQLGWLGQIGWQFSFCRELMLPALASILLAFAAFLASAIRLHRAVPTTPCCPAAAIAVGTFFSSAAMNAAWLSAATSVQFLIYNQAHPTGLKEECTGVVLLAIAGVGGLAMLLKFKDVIYPATLVWALTAIYQKTESEHVQLATKVLGVVLAVLTVGAFLCKLMCKVCKLMKCCPCKKRTSATCGSGANGVDGSANDTAAADIEKKLLDP